MAREVTLEHDEVTHSLHTLGDYFTGLGTRNYLAIIYLSITSRTSYRSRFPPGRGGKQCNRSWNFETLMPRNIKSL